MKAIISVNTERQLHSFAFAEPETRIIVVFLEVKVLRSLKRECCCFCT